ncbi:lysylphosphatidylglycerol synthase transmembrane domain-containing protein [Actinacidiphila acidipaludis]|uniref:Flippase-like domain-containing protein n=1 Tax=Actinacidiphila acidipaludis TaxID=2873382 RepID=A0ABS7Q045_9ACTN|nr:lysylphosphatidylglycerol synthase transmembrane domain-containing protein [Streptomyces acidipaludis]MBY8876271.1 flippase-like domain-containing protein [Streptomyces acidipaludis]
MRDHSGGGHSREGPADRDAGSSRWPRRIWWVVAGAVLAGVTAAAVVRRSEVAGALRLVAHVDPLPLAAAAACQAASLLCFAGVWRWLLDAGGARWPLRRVAALTLGGNAVSGALPGGAVLATAWAYRQLRRRGIDTTLAAAVLAVAGALSGLGLGVIGAVALIASGPSPRAVVVWTMVVLLIVLVSAACFVVLVRRSDTVRRGLRRVWAAATRRSVRARDLGTLAGRIAEQAWNLKPGLRPWLSPAAQALFNWVFDLACLVLCLRALNITVPWPGVLGAYVLTQIPASLRLTPGNIGVVEAGLAALLAAYGVPSSQALAGALLYRAVSYWAVQPIGWCCCAAVTLRGRRA